MWDLKINTNKGYFCVSKQKDTDIEKELVFSSGEGEKRKDTIKGMKLGDTNC